MELYYKLSYNSEVDKFDIFNNNINKINYFINNNSKNKIERIKELEFNEESRFYNFYEHLDKELFSTKNTNKFIIKHNVYIKKKDSIVNECPVCYNNINPINHIKLICDHILCKICYTKWNNECNKNNMNIICPLCRKS